MFEKLLDSAFWAELLRRFLEWSVSNLPSILLIIVLLIFSLWFLRFSVKRLKKFIVARSIKGEDISSLESQKRVDTLLGILKGTGRIIIWVVFLMLLLRKFGIDIGPILAGAGILGLAVGFGAQELVRDVISGFFLLLEDQVRAGDVAIINGTGGLVEKIELRTITLRDLSGVVHVFQNGKINTLSNMTKEWSAMVFDIGVAYKENTDQVMQIMKKVGDEMQADPEFGEKILEPIEVLGLEQFADSAIVIRARMKTRPIAQWSIGREYRNRLKKAFDAENIEIPFPHTTLYWGDNLEALKVNLEGKNPAG